MKTIACTVCSLNHLAGAIALGQSLQAHHPDWRFVIGLCDRLDGRVAADEIPFEVLEIERVAGVTEGGLVERYPAFELNCAVKPYLAAHLLAEDPDAERLVFADSDIRLYAPLASVERLLDDASLVLSPHRLSPPRDASTRPPEDSFNIWGIYNAGFFALRRSPAATAFLAWWSERTRDKCFILIEQGWVVDQIWLNFAPIYFREVAVLCDPGCNVAYWNLDERALRRGDAGLQLESGEPLRFFHFSGFDWREPGVLTARYPRLSHADNPVLRELQHEYAANLRKNGVERFAALPNALAERQRDADSRRLARLSLLVRWSLPLRRLARRVGFQLVHRLDDERRLSKRG